MATHGMKPSARSLVEQQHFPLDLVKEAINYFERPQHLWTEHQKLALVSLRDWYALFERRVHDGDTTLLEGNGFVQTGARLISKVFLLDSVGDVPMYWDPQLHQQSNGWDAGITHWSWQNPPLRVRLNPNNWWHRAPDGSPRLEIIETMLHELCHVLVHKYSCAWFCGPCSWNSHRHDQLAICGKSGHGIAWQVIAYAVESSFNKFLSVSFDVGRKQGAVTEFEMTGLVPSDDIVRRCFNGKCPVTGRDLPVLTVVQQVYRALKLPFSTAVEAKPKRAGYAMTFHPITGAPTSYALTTTEL